MIQEQTLSQVIVRLEALENEVRTMKAGLMPPPEPFHFEFVIQVEGREVWAGKDLPSKYPEILEKYPDSQISISWRSSPVILI